MWIVLIAIVAAFAFLYFFNYFYNKNELKKLSSKEDVIYEVEYTETEIAEKIGIHAIDRNMITEMSGNIVAVIRYSTEEFHLLDGSEGGEQDAYEDALMSFALALNFDIKVIEIAKEISGKTIVEEMKLIDEAMGDKEMSPVDIYRRELIEHIENSEKKVALEKNICCFTKNEKDKSKRLKQLKEKVAQIQQTLPFEIEVLETNDLIELNALMIRKKTIDVESIERSGGFELHA